ncbi:MAG: 50S ribosomal protein L25/general stress protein Ctc [Propionibacteriaceae bacterium]|jgi:large subunit ribosomal protein L25|nr:50S ribosomal protein L25/general stress protein Ctc [Propionibacteriaceae bacterium]
MADQVVLNAQERTEFGKGAARRLRREHRVPAVLYGHGAEPIHVSLPEHETMLALRVANAVLTLEIEGKESQLALAKDIQRHPIKDLVEHVDLLAVRRGEKVTVEVPLTIVGEIRGEHTIITDQTTISLEVEATHIPADIEIDISNLAIGDSVAAKDLVLPQGAVFTGDPDDLMLSIQAPSAADLGEAPEGAEESEDESAEGAEEE